MQTVSTNSIPALGTEILTTLREIREDIRLYEAVVSDPEDKRTAARKGAHLDEAIRALSHP